MNNFDDIFESAAASGQPGTCSRWQVRQQHNLENAYAMIDAALEEISRARAMFPVIWIFRPDLTAILRAMFFSFRSSAPPPPGWVIRNIGGNRALRFCALS